MVVIGYVIDFVVVSNVFCCLEVVGYVIKGLMIWLVNWDDGLNKCGECYNWEFCKCYVSFIYDGEGGD